MKRKEGKRGSGSVMMYEKIQVVREKSMNNVKILRVVIRTVGTDILVILYNQ